MQVILLTDRDMALRERAMVRRLQIGLTDEGVDVIQVAPASVVSRVHDGMFARLVSFDDRPAMFRSISQSILAEELTPMVQDEASLIIHVFGVGMLPVGYALARRFSCAVAVDVHSAACAQKLAHIGASAGSSAMTAFLAPDPALQRRLIARLASSRKPDIATRCVPWGVLCPPAIHPILDQRRTPTILIGGSGEHRQAYVAVLEALASIAAEEADFLALVDADVAQRASLGPVIARLGLNDRISQVPSIEADRPPALHADVLVLPEAIGEHRSIVLDAMASGVLVLAQEDPLVSIVRDGQTALCVRHESTNAWRMVIAEVLANPERARNIAQQSRDYVANEHKASTHTAGVLDTYEWLTSTGSLRINVSK